MKQPREKRMRSNLLTAQALCEEDFVKRGKLHYDSVETDPSNNYAVERATLYQNFLVQSGILPKIGT